MLELLVYSFFVISHVQMCFQNSELIYTVSYPNFLGEKDSKRKHQRVCLLSLSAECVYEITIPADQYQ